MSMAVKLTKIERVELQVPESNKVYYENRLKQLGFSLVKSTLVKASTKNIGHARLFNWVAERCVEVNDELASLEQLDPNFGKPRSSKHPLPDYGDLFPIDEWKEAVKNGSFIPYDGTGYYATETEMDIDTDSFEPPPKWATHVAWFNK
ncbi:MAG: hypothetical protein HC888_03950 [Candidatus Competibacteraceae bacterium]|nr:hypothetical protein [Candidatus Competibacteraceae bacterium]